MAMAVRHHHLSWIPPVKPESLKVAHIIHGAWGVEAPNGFLTVVFAAHEWTGEPESREPRKHSRVCWVDANAIPDAFVDTTASALHQYRECKSNGGSDDHGSDVK